MPPGRCPPQPGERRGVSDYLLDTAVLIRCLRGIPETLALARSLTEEGDLHISVWSQFEVLTLTTPREEKHTLEFLAPFIVHTVNEPIAQRAAGLLRSRAANVARLNFAEALIAATALQLGLTLVTYDSQNVRPIEQLRIYPAPTALAPRGAV